MSHSEENKAQCRRTLEEVFNQGHLAHLDELLTPDREWAFWILAHLE